MRAVPVEAQDDRTVCDQLPLDVEALIRKRLAELKNLLTDRLRCVDEDGIRSMTAGRSPERSLEMPLCRPVVSDGRAGEARTS